MGSSKKHKSDKREKHEDKYSNMDYRPPSLKLILKVGNSSTPEYGSSDSPAYGLQSPGNNYYASGEYSGEKHKKSKKKKKKKDREKHHKHHHKEKRKHREDSSQEDFSIVGDDSSQLQEANLRYPAISSVQSMTTTTTATPSPMSSLFAHQVSPNTDSYHGKHLSDNPCTPSSSDSSTREPRTCVLKMKQSNSPLNKLLEYLLKNLEKKDPHQFFAWPVTNDIAPGYSSIITHPMDFSTIRQKIDDSRYQTLQDFSSDFTLMCENAIKYNHIDTVYHKAAKKLLHVGSKMLIPENLQRMLHPMPAYMKDLSVRELGFELPFHEHNDIETIPLDSADEGLSLGGFELPPLTEEEERKRLLRMENQPKTHFEPFVDDLSPEEILAQVNNASGMARKRLMAKRTPRRMGFLRQNKEGVTSMKILLDTDNSYPERVVSLGEFTGKLQSGTGQLQTFREDRRNNVRAVKGLNYGAFCTFGPYYDSRFANLTKEESDLVISTYGDEVGATYTNSIMEFTNDSPFASTLANGLLDILTNGEHRKTMSTLTENQNLRIEEFEIEQRIPDTNEESSKKLENVKIDFDGLQSLSNEIGVDMSFLKDIEMEYKTAMIHKMLGDKLTTNSSLIERLQQAQHERLSQPLPNHLAHISHPNVEEIELAAQITSNLMDMAKQLNPEAITAPPALRKAMGITNVGLINEVFQRRLQTANMINKSSLNQFQTDDKKTSDDMDTTPVPMDLEPEDHVVHHHNNTSNPLSVDLDDDFRDLLGHDNGILKF